MEKVLDKQGLIPSLKKSLLSPFLFWQSISTLRPNVCISKTNIQFNPFYSLLRRSNPLVHWPPLWEVNGVYIILLVRLTIGFLWKKYYIDFIRRHSLISHSTFQVQHLNKSLLIQEFFILSVFISLNREHSLKQLCLLMKSTR